LRDDFGNLALVIAGENAGNKEHPLDDWLATRSPEYLNRHLIPGDKTLWHIDKYDSFLIERRKLLRTRIQPPKVRNESEGPGNPPVTVWTVRPESAVLRFVHTLTSLPAGRFPRWARLRPRNRTVNYPPSRHLMRV
jgi:hypothetical protein